MHWHNPVVALIFEFGIQQALVEVGTFFIVIDVVIAVDPEVQVHVNTIFYPTFVMLGVNPLLQLQGEFSASGKLWLALLTTAQFEDVEHIQLDPTVNL